MYTYSHCDSFRSIGKRQLATLAADLRVELNWDTGIHYHVCMYLHTCVRHTHIPLAHLGAITTSLTKTGL